MSPRAAALAFTALVVAAPAVAKPTFEELDDIDRWHAGADRLMDGPKGCWMFEGEAKQVFALHQAPDRFSVADEEVLESSGVFVARMEDGVWTRIDFRRTYSDEDKQIDLDLTPLIGRTGKEGSGTVSISFGGDESNIAGGVAESMNVLRDAIERLSGSVETRMAKWDEASSSVRYLREVAVEDGSNDLVTVTSTFPDGGPLATRIDAVWPKHLKVGEWPFKVSLRDPQAHVLGYVHEGDVLPNAESVSIVIGVIGFTVGYEQHIRYLTAAPCGG